MRSVTDNFDASLKQTGTTFARLWTITRKDGAIIRLTDHDSNVIIGLHIFSSSIGFTTTAVMTSSLSIGAQTVELKVPLVDLGVTEDDLRHRIYEEAAAVLEVVDYDHPEYGTMVLFSGLIGRVVLSDKKRANIEVISFTDPNVNVANEQYSATCRNDLGDSLCKFNLFSMAVNFTVVSNIDTMAFTVNTLSGQKDNFFALGQIKWLTGENKGLVSDVRTTALGLLSVGLFYPLPFPIAVGNTGQLLPGCDHQLTTCFSKFNNVVNFRAEPFAPAFGI